MKDRKNCVKNVKQWRNLTANKTEFGENFEFQIDNGSAKNVRINDVREGRNLTAYGTECGEYSSSDR